MKKIYFLTVGLLFMLSKLGAQHLLIEKMNGTIIEIPINDIDSITFAENPIQFTCGLSTITDFDGNVYNTVLIGEQCWMNESIRTTKDAVGNSINRRCYNDLTPYCFFYGGLYTWGAAMNGANSSNNVPSGVQGICPTGWHLPSKAEWEQLIAYLDAQGYPNNDVPEGAGNALKSCRQINSPFDAGCNTSEHPRWEAHATHNGFDTYGFSGLPGGTYEYESYEYLGVIGGWWTTTDSPGMGNWRFKLRYFRGDLSPDDYSSFYYSVRCLRYNIESSYVPIGAFTGSPTNGIDPLTVNFTDQSSHNPTSWTWDFGDGNGSTQQNPSHTYQNAGIYTVSLLVSNSLGTDTETKINYIYVGSGNGCDGLTEFSYGGQTYNTVEIGDQCWMAENLNYETGSSWCYNNDTANCAIYGRLYDYQTALIACPPGWHLPTDQEWKTLEGIVDSQYGVGHSVWNAIDWRGSDVGKKLKATTGWNYGGNGTDDYGFGALPGGYAITHGLGTSGYWWTSNAYTYRGLGSYSDQSNRRSHENAFSVRCLKD